MVLLTAALVAIGLSTAALADRWLTAGGGPDLGVLQLRLLYNPGVAFGLGDTLSPWFITAATAVVIAAYAWAVVARTGPIGRAGLAAVLAGAISNLIDRAADGVVTDYLHTGWFPTFNLPDVFITIGAALIVLSALVETQTSRRAPKSTGFPPERR